MFPHSKAAARPHSRFGPHKKATPLSPNNDKEVCAICHLDEMCLFVLFVCVIDMKYVLAEGHGREWWAAVGKL